ncbi:hypothetical protein ACFLQN_01755 [Candidatus Aenigmatarchaeota archaeon]
MNTEKLKEAISEFWNLDKKNIEDSFVFNNETIKNFSSIKFYRFIAFLEDRFNITVKNIEKIIDLKTLEENCTGE